MKNIDYTQNCIDLTDVKSEKELIEILTSAEFNQCAKEYRGVVCKIIVRGDDMDDAPMVVRIVNAWTERYGNFLMIAVIDTEEDFHKLLYYNDSDECFKCDNPDFNRKEGWPKRFNWEEEDE